MTVYTYDERIVSDLHKDTYGFRPHAGWWTEWKESDEDGKQAIWDMLLESLDETMAYEKRQQDAAIESFEARILQLIELGAGDRLTAIRWIVEGMDLDYTDLCYGGERIVWGLGLPYSMASLFAEAVEALKAAKKETE